MGFLRKKLKKESSSKTGKENEVGENEERGEGEVKVGENQEGEEGELENGNDDKEGGNVWRYRLRPRN
jgi:hypothetical protein